MAYDKVVDSQQLDADLTSVANAIRTRGGTSAQLAFPADFVSAVQAIPSGGGGQLPAGCTRVDWLQSDGTAYVDTGISLDDNEFSIAFDSTFLTSSTSSAELPVISIWTSTYNYWNVFYQNNQLRWYIAQTSNIRGSLTYYTWVRATIRRVGGTWSSDFTDGTYTNNRTGYNPTANPTTIKLFTRGDLNGTNSLVRIGRVSITISGTLTADLIPCTNAANVAGFYDIVRGAFYGNGAASGAFTAGPATVY